MEDRQRLKELTGTNRPTQTTTPLNTTHLACVRMPGGERYSMRKASTIRSTPNPTTHKHTHAACGQRAAQTTRQSNNPHHNNRQRPTHCPYSRLGGHSDRETPGIPSRTRKLSLTAPMVLHPPGCGRVGHHRAPTTQLAREPPTTAAPGQLLYTPTNKTTTHKQQKPGWIQDRSDIGVRNGAPLSP